jgi:hypothetical protein
MTEINSTTRMFPRTMQEAFEDPVETAQWFYPPERNLTLESFMLMLSGIGIWLFIAWLFLGV